MKCYDSSLQIWGKIVINSMIKPSFCVWLDLMQSWCCWPKLLKFVENVMFVLRTGIVSSLEKRGGSCCRKVGETTEIWRIHFGLHLAWIAGMLRLNDISKPHSNISSLLKPTNMSVPRQFWNARDTNLGGGCCLYSLFTLRKPRSPLILSGERGFCRMNTLYGHCLPLLICSFCWFAVKLC